MGSVQASGPVTYISLLLLSDDTRSKLFQLLKRVVIPGPSELRTQIALGLLPCLLFFFS